MPTFDAIFPFLFWGGVGVALSAFMAFVLWFFREEIWPQRFFREKARPQLSGGTPDFLFGFMGRSAFFCPNSSPARLPRNDEVTRLSDANAAEPGLSDSQES
jgi:hypothetical protein